MLGKGIGASNRQIQEIRKSGRAIQRMDLERNKPKLLKRNIRMTMHGDDPIWSLPPDDPRLQYALRWETYPVEVRERLIPLGQEFAEAVLSIQRGNGVDGVSISQQH